MAAAAEFEDLIAYSSDHSAFDFTDKDVEEEYFKEEERFKPQHDQASCKELLERPQIGSLAESRSLSFDVIKSILVHELHELKDKSDKLSPGPACAAGGPMEKERWVTERVLPRKKGLCESQRLPCAPLSFAASAVLRSSTHYNRKLVAPLSIFRRCFKGAQHDFLV